MKKIVKFFALLMVCLFVPGCLVNASASGDSDTLVVGTEAAFAPYEFIQNNKIVGIDMDIAQAVADAMGKKLVVKNMDFDGALLAVQQGKVDFVAAGVSVSEERKKTMDFSDYYVDSTEVIVVNKANPGVVGTKDLNGKKIGVQQGNIADIWVSDKENVKAKEVKRYSTFAQAAQDLVNQKIDCIVLDEVPARNLVGENNKLSILEGEENILFSDHYAIAVQKGNEELLEQINSVIEKLKTSQMDEIVQKYTSGGGKDEQKDVQIVDNKKTSLLDKYYDAFFVEHRYKNYLNGLVITIKISFFAILLGTLLGVILAIGTVSAKQNKKLKPLGIVCGLYTTIIRGTPVLVQLLIIYNLIFTSRDSNPILTGAVAFGINSSAYVAEIVRAGIESIDNGQMEAGRSLGFTNAQTMSYIILPQAVKNILPALGNEFIALIKETSIAGYIAVTDLTKAAQYVSSRTFDPLPPLVIAAAFYLVMVVGLTKLLKVLERRMAQE